MKRLIAIILLGWFILATCEQEEKDLELREANWKEATKNLPDPNRKTHHYDWELGRFIYEDELVYSKRGYQHPRTADGINKYLEDLVEEKLEEYGR